MFEEVIEQEKSNEELVEYGRKIIDLLKPLNKVEKLKVIAAAHHSLVELLQQQGVIIEIKSQ